MSKIAALMSGGMDSGALTAYFLESSHQVYPVYLRHGLHWETCEELHLRKFLDAIACDNLHGLRTFDMPVGDIYQNHWSVSGVDVPDQDSEDSAVFLPGRNLLLLAKTGVWCALNNIEKIALGPLKGNPFSDNTDEFYLAMGKAISVATEHKIEILRPFAQKTKAEVIRAASHLPLHLTFSCIRPTNNKHCGVCNKCAERQLAYRDLDLLDYTEYCAASLAASPNNG